MAYPSLRPWATPLEQRKLDEWITTITFGVVIMLFLYPVFVGGTLSSIIINQTTTLYILFMMLFIWSVQILKKTDVYASLGERKNMLVGMVGGVGVGIIIISAQTLKTFIGNFQIQLAIPLSATTGVGSVFYAICTVIFIPIAEERVFAQYLPYKLAQSIKNPFLVKIICSILFGLFHLLAYSASFPQMIMAVIFRYATLEGNELTKTYTFGLSMHMLNNLIAVLRGI
jgi:membrane protease YdiL (CAAX protease family)